MPPRRDPASISPTAHYTGYVWARYGLSDRALRTPEGALFHALLRPANLFQERILRGPTLDGVLLDRHVLIDHELEARIQRGAVGQVLELAAGMSPRGARFARRHPGLRYVEADLPAMVARKQEATAKLGLGPGHTVVPVDAFKDRGEGSLDALASQHLDPTQGVAVITEGLINYFDADAVEGLWARIASVLARFPGGVYLSDIHLHDETLRVYGARWFKGALERFSKGGVTFHYSGAPRCERALRAAGFREATLLRPSEVALPRPPGAPERRGADLGRVIVATV